LQAVNHLDERIIALALRLSDVAGDILRRHFRMPLPVVQKADESPVTLADREVEHAMRAAIEAEFPEHGIIGEEFGDVRDEAAYQWVLDPIDGTRSFLGGYPLFTTLISLTHKGLPLLGVIYQPVLRERWFCVRGGTSTLTDATGIKPAIVRGGRGLAAAVVATTSADYFTPLQLESFLKLKKHCAGSVLGGDAYAYAMLASGQIDVVVDAGLKPFDYCALVPVIEGAGGIITDWNGKAVTLGCDGRILAAANAALHAEALAHLR
jgi:myo-inositol-1(or 4)-monophosphatase